MKRKIQVKKQYLFFHVCVIISFLVLILDVSGILNIPQFIINFILYFSIFNGILACIRHYNYVLKIDYEILKKHQIKSDSYRLNLQVEKVRGIMLCCTGMNNPNLKQYVDYHQAVGYNEKQDHWNRQGKYKMPHIFIGYDKNQKIIAVNTLPYTTCGSVCGKGANGSFDLSPNGHIQIMICEDSFEDKEYFKEIVFGAAVQICSVLLAKNGLKSKTVISDKEAFDSGFANEYSNFTDWLNKYGYTIEDFRSAVKARLTLRKIFSDKWECKNLP